MPSDQAPAHTTLSPVTGIEIRNILKGTNQEGFLQRILRFTPDDFVSSKIAAKIRRKHLLNKKGTKLKLTISDVERSSKTCAPLYDWGKLNESIASKEAFASIPTIVRSHAVPLLRQPFTWSISSSKTTPQSEKPSAYPPWLEAHTQTQESRPQLPGSRKHRIHRHLSFPGEPWHLLQCRTPERCLRPLWQKVRRQNF